MREQPPSLAILGADLDALLSRRALATSELEAVEHELENARRALLEAMGVPETMVDALERVGFGGE